MNQSTDWSISYLTRWDKSVFFVSLYSSVTLVVVLVTCVCWCILSSHCVSTADHRPSLVNCSCWLCFFFFFSFLFFVHLALSRLSDLFTDSINCLCHPLWILFHPVCARQLLLSCWCSIKLERNVNSHTHSVLQTRVTQYDSCSLHQCVKCVKWYLTTTTNEMMQWLLGFIRTVTVSLCHSVKCSCKEGDRERKRQRKRKTVY